MPHQTVAVYLQAQLAGIVDELVGYAEVEDALGRCQHFGLHAILGYHTIEMLAEHGIGRRNLSVALPLVDGGTDQTVFANGILQALSLNGAKCCHEQQSR